MSILICYCSSFLFFFYSHHPSGLVAAEEKPKKKGDVSKVIRKDLSGKHPVMALNELCNKRRWGKPNFEVVREDGPPHKKNFVFKVQL